LLNKLQLTAAQIVPFFTMLPYSLTDSTWHSRSNSCWSLVAHCFSVFSPTFEHS